MKNGPAMAAVVLTIVFATLMLVGFAGQVSAPAAAQANDPRLRNAYRFEQGGWVYVHLEGAPANVGFQHGYLLAPEIADAFNVIKTMDTRRTKRDWEFFRKTAQDVLWPHIETEYREELQGIADGLKAHGVSMDVWDVVALNAFEEVPDYYLPWLEKQTKSEPAAAKPPGHCSAFVATGSYTKGGQIVMAHNAWTSYYDGERWNIIFDIQPERGHRILMDGFPGVITSDDDFGINDAGLMVTETTITQFFGFDPNGKPEFVRSRKALQYAAGIDEYAAIMQDGNNGGYANDWLIGDRKTGDVAQLELGLKHVKLWRTKDGYFSGSNWARDPEVIRDETPGFDPNDLSSSPNARRQRWEQLMAENKGKIDVAMAQQFLSDHYDSFEKKEQPNERTLCGHVDLSPRGLSVWDRPPYYPEGAVQGKVTDSEMTKAMTLRARMGHPCGSNFKAAPFLAQRSEFAYMKPVLRDMDAGPWTTFRIGQKK